MMILVVGAGVVGLACGRALALRGELQRIGVELVLAADSLYAAGMTSHASVNVMLGVEDAFDLEFPEQMLTKETFESLESIAAAVRTLEEQQ